MWSSQDPSGQEVEDPTMHTRGQVFLWLCRLLSAVWSQFRNNSPAAEYPEQQQGMFSEKESREDCIPAAEETTHRAPVLIYPDPARCYILDTCSSNAAVAAVLQQMVDGEERVVTNYNQAFSPFQQNYYMTRSELLAMVLSVTHLDCTYTDGSLGYGQTTHL